MIRLTVMRWWQRDQSEALITFVQVLGRPNVHSRRIRIPGLDEKKKYRVETTGKCTAEIPSCMRD